MLKYNLSYGEGSFDDYLKYLDTIRAKLPEALFDFVSDPHRHDFSPTSLHDGWVKSIECTSDFDTGSMRLTMKIVGAEFDREFHLCFNDVSQYKVAQSWPEMDRDLISYEVGVEEDRYRKSKLVFRAIFSNEANEIEVLAKNITITEVLI